MQVCARQTVALPPLCFCKCYQDLFCTKTCLVPFLIEKPFHSFKWSQFCIHYWQPEIINPDKKSLQIQAKSCDFILSILNLGDQNTVWHLQCTWPRNQIWFIQFPVCAHVGVLLTALKFCHISDFRSLVWSGRFISWFLRWVRPGCAPYISNALLEYSSKYKFKTFIAGNACCSYKTQ